MALQVDVDQETAASDASSAGARQRTRASNLLVEVVVGAVAGVCALVPIANAWTPGFPFDDAYISFSYAQQLAIGHGLRLGPGAPRVEAFSDPLWVSVLALGRLIHIPAPTLSTILNVALVAVLAGSTMRLIRRLNPWAPLWIGVVAALAIGLLPAIGYFVLGGLETLLFAALLNGVMLALLRDRERARALSVGTVVLCLLLAGTRPEGLLVWAAAYAVSWWWCRRMRSQVISALWFVIPAGLAELGRALYFGQLLANSEIAKSGLGISQSIPFVKAEAQAVWHQYALLFVVTACVCVVAFVWRSFLPAIRPLAIVAFVTGCFEFATSSGDNYAYQRYVFPLLALMLAISVAGLSRLAWGADGGWWSSRPRLNLGGRALRVIVTGSVVAVFVFAVWQTAEANRSPTATSTGQLSIARAWSMLGDLFRPDNLQNHYGPYQYGLARLLNQSEPPGAEIAMDEIGTVSYYTRLHVLDLYGLADSHIANLPGEPGRRADPDFVFGSHPSAIVILVGGSLTAATPDDAAYVEDPRMLGYRLADLLYSYHTLNALLFLREPGVATLVSLDRRIPTGVRETVAMPPTIAAMLQGQISSQPDGIPVAPSAAIEAAGVLATRSELTAIDAGRDASVRLPGGLSGRCTLHATALAPGSAPNGWLAVTVASSSAPDRSIRVNLRGTSVRQVALPLPATASVARFSGSAASMWAEPFVTCRAPTR